MSSQNPRPKPSRARHHRFLPALFVGGILLAPPSEAEAQLINVTLPECPSMVLAEWMCGPLGDAYSFASGFTNEVGSIVTDATSTFQQHVEGIAGTIVPPNVVARFNDAVELSAPIMNGMQEIFDHPVCGSEAALGELATFFEYLGETANTIEGLGEQIVSAGFALAPIWDAGDGILNEVGSIMGKPWEPGSEADQYRRQLEQAAENLSLTLLKIGSKEGVKAAMAGVDAVPAAVKIWGFAGACVTCTKSIATSVSGAIAAATSTPALAACPSTFAAYGGGCWGAIPGGGGGLTAGLGFISANMTCGGVAAGLSDMPGAIVKIAKFAMASWDLVAALAETQPMAQAVHDAAVALGHAVGVESAAELAAIEARLNEIGAAANAAIDLLGPVAEEAMALATQTLEQTGDRVMQTIECYNMMNGIAASVSQEMLAAVSDSLYAAANNLTGGATGLDGVLASVSTAAQASTSATTSEFQDIHSDLQGIVTALWGPVPGDLGQVIQHLAFFATNPAAFQELISKTMSLAERHVNLPSVALQAGLDALADVESDAAVANAMFRDASTTSLRAHAVLSQPPNPPLMAHAPMSDPGFGSEPAVVVWNGPILPAHHDVWVFGDFASMSGTEVRVDPAATLKGYLDEVRTVRFRELVDPRSGATGPCLNCPRQFELATVKTALDRATVRGGVEVLVVDTRGATVFSLGRFSSADAIPTQHVVQPPVGGFPASGAGCSLSIEVRDDRGSPLARSSICLNDG